MKNLFSLLLLLLLTGLNAQYASNIHLPDTTMSPIDDPADMSYFFSQTITKENLRSHLQILASDEMEGRETGQPGNEKAADYIANFFKSRWFPSLEENTEGYFQTIAFTHSKWTTNNLVINDNEYRHLWDYLSFPTKNETIESIMSNKIYYLGYGIDDPNYSDYRDKNFEDEIIMIYKGEPMKTDSTYWVSNSKESSAWSSDIEMKLRLAKEKKVKMVLIIEDDITGLLAQNRRIILGRKLEIGDKTKNEKTLANHIYISPKMAMDLVGHKLGKVKKARDKSREKGQGADVKLSAELFIQQIKDTKVLRSNNVMGYLEGTDLKDEVIVITAHYDHLGKRGDYIYNGADDNGSGTSAILELAEAFSIAAQLNQRPRRSILFLLVTGEEKGLLGSNYYTQKPLFPLESTVANINLDMIGRIDPKYDLDSNYVYVIGSDRISIDLHDINQEVNQKYTQLTLDYTYNSITDPNRFYYRSDHYNFAKNGIPSIFFFNGTHADYHRTSDTAEKINYGKMETITRLVFHTVWEVANRDERLKIDKT